jgi:hypothetical protein
MVVTRTLPRNILDLSNMHGNNDDSSGAIHEELKLSRRKHWNQIERNKFMKTIQELLEIKCYSVIQKAISNMLPAFAFELNYEDDARKEV